MALESASKELLGITCKSQCDPRKTHLRVSFRLLHGYSCWEDVKVAPRKQNELQGHCEQKDDDRLEGSKRKGTMSQAEVIRK